MLPEIRLEQASDWRESNDGASQDFQECNKSSYREEERNNFVILVELCCNTKQLIHLLLLNKRYWDHWQGYPNSQQELDRHFNIELIFISEWTWVELVRSGR
jgi:hypothetical protein